MIFEQEGDSFMVIYIINFMQYLFLFVEEKIFEVQVCIVLDLVLVDMDVCLLREKVDYFVFFVLFKGEKEVVVCICYLLKEVLCWKEFKFLDIFDMINID